MHGASNGTPMVWTTAADARAAAGAARFHRDESGVAELSAPRPLSEDDPIEEFDCGRDSMNA